jgi:predicted deacylase
LLSRTPDQRLQKNKSFLLLFFKKEGLALPQLPCAASSIEYPYEAERRSGSSKVRGLTQETPLCSAQAALPNFAVDFSAPDLAPWRAGNFGLPGFWRFAAAEPGPNVVVTALVHGNEIAGAVALDHMLRTPPKPLRGTLTLGFVNLDAYDRFDAAQPTASRYVDEDMNRLWDEAVLDGPRKSSELARARTIRPVIDAADILLDLHSMLWPSESLILCGPAQKGRKLATSIGSPPLVVADHGHASGRRLIDYAPFVDPESAEAAVLVEAGPHWKIFTIDAMEVSIAGLLAATGLALPRKNQPRAEPRLAEVTVAVTASSGGFSFVRDFRGGDVVPLRNTLIATDGATEIRTPHDDCLLVMPSLRPSRGHTAVRLARFV